MQTIHLHAQQFREYVAKTVLGVDSLMLDSLPILHHSLHAITPNFRIGIDATLQGSYLLLHNKIWLNQPISLTYERLNFTTLSFPNRYEQVQLLDSFINDTLRTAVLVNTAQTKISGRYNTSNPASLQKNGLFMRGVDFGNKQSLSAQSTLQLQLQGALTDRVSIRAVISDYQLPLQASGTTAKINELDQIFVELSSHNHKLVAGDYWQHDSTSFLRIEKKRQGFNYEGSFPLANKTLFSQQIGFSIAKGVFHRMQFRGAEGNQGPYRLYGKNGELAIVILSGSEKVYINGDLQTRGEEADYTIDYNTAELTFTLKRSINQNSRIAVEYEYANRTYLRYSLANTTRWHTEKSDVYLSYTGEFDDKYTQLNQTLSEAQIRILQQAGSEPALAPTAQVSDFNTDEIFYLQRDTLVQGQTYSSIFVRQYTPNSESYRLRFTYVGAGQGNYRIQTSTENQRIYEWVAPVAGVAQGDYSPNEILQAPQRQQMLVVGSSLWQNRLKLELALTNRDRNTFSSLDNTQNNALGFSLQFADTIPRKDSANALNYSLNYEYTGHKFEQFDRIRELEFARNWGLDDESYFFTGHLFRAQAYWRHKYHELIVKPAALRSDTGDLAAIRNDLIWRYIRKKWTFTSENNMAYNSSNSIHAAYLKTVNRLQHDLGNWSLGTFLKMKRKTLNPLINQNSEFIDYHAFVSYRKKKNVEIILQLGQRYDFSITSSAQQLFPEERSDEVALTTNFYRKNATFLVLANLRHVNTLDIPDYYRLNLRIKQNFSAWSKNIRANLFFESKAGQEVAHEYQYIKVDAGLGEYKWVDYNNNGLQEQGEFERAVFDDEGDFVKVLLPSQNYEAVQNENLNISLQISPRIQSKLGFFKQFARTQWRLNYTAATKVRPTNWWELGAFIDPTAEPLLSTEKIVANLRWSGVKGRWQGELGFLSNNSGLLLVQGFEDTGLETKYIKLLRRLGKWVLSTKYAFSKQFSISEVNVNRNFDFSTHQNRIEVIWNGIDALKLTGFARVAVKATTKDRTQASEQLTLYHVGFVADWKLPKRMQLKTEIDFASIHYNQPNNSPLSIAMLEGFQLNKNIFTKIEFNRRFGKFLEVAVSYQARFAEKTDIVQTGKLQVKAVF